MTPPDYPRWLVTWQILSGTLRRCWPRILESVPCKKFEMRIRQLGRLERYPAPLWQSKARRARAISQLISSVTDLVESASGKEQRYHDMQGFKEQTMD